MSHPRKLEKPKESVKKETKELTAAGLLASSKHKELKVPTSTPEKATVSWKGQIVRHGLASIVNVPAVCTDTAAS